MKTFWRISLISLGVVIFLLAGLTAYRIPAVLERQKTQKAVEFIQSQKLTLDDVTGKHLPSPPDPAEADATVEGVDANGNGIRDDVELAIFKKYPNSARIRAAELQYAKALQMYLVSVFNSETWIAVTQQIGRGFGCVYDGTGDVNSTLKETREIEDIVRNSKERENRNSSLEKFRTSFAVSSDKDCDINLMQ